MVQCAQVGRWIAASAMTAVAGCGAGGPGAGSTSGEADASVVTQQTSSSGSSSTNGGGSSTPDGGPPGDAATTSSPSDGGACVQVNIDGLDSSCDQDSDCLPVYVGTACDGDCLCDANAAINRSAVATYETRLSTIGPRACPCHANAARCMAHACVSAND